MATLSGSATGGAHSAGNAGAVVSSALGVARAVGHSAGRSSGFVLTATRVNAISRPRVPETSKNEAQHRLQLAHAINRAIRGNLDCNIQVTLQPFAGQTIIEDARVSVWTAPHMAPITGSAAAEIASGQCFAVPSNGQVTIFHSNSGIGDRVFNVSLVG